MPCNCVDSEKYEFIDYFLATCKMRDQLCGDNYHYRCVAHEIKKTTILCTFCGEEDERWDEVHSIQQLSLPLDRSRLLQETGLIDFNE